MVRRGKAVTGVLLGIMRHRRLSQSIFIFDMQESQSVSQSVNLSLKCAAADTQDRMQSCGGDHLPIMSECSCPNKNSKVALHITGSSLMRLQRHIRPLFIKLSGWEISPNWPKILCNIDLEVKTFYRHCERSVGICSLSHTDT